MNIKGDIAKTLPEISGVSIDKIMTVKEYADMISKSSNRVYQLIKKDELKGAKAYRRGNTILIAVD